MSKSAIPLCVQLTLRAVGVFIGGLTVTLTAGSPAGDSVVQRFLPQAVGRHEPHPEFPAKPSAPEVARSNAVVTPVQTPPSAVRAQITAEGAANPAHAASLVRAAIAAYPSLVAQFVSTAVTAAPTPALGAAAPAPATSGIIVLGLTGA